MTRAGHRATLSEFIDRGLERVIHDGRKLDRLERDQLLERLRDQVDRRSVKLAITAKGEELVSIGFQAAMGVYTALLSDTEAISQLADTLQEVHENLQKAGPYAIDLSL